jgi:hypothetical protein
VPGDDFGVSEALRRTRDEEVQEIAEEAYRGAHRLLVDHRDLLDEIARRLLDNEVIEREEIQEIMAATRAELERAPEPEPRVEREAAADRARAFATKPPRADI